MNNAYDNYLMIMTDLSNSFKFVDICPFEANGGRVSENMCLRNQNILMRIELFS